MEPRQRSFLVSTLVGFGLLALLFKFVVQPIQEHPEREAQREAQERRAQQVKERSSEISELQDVMARARAKWRADVVAANATGATGSIPPLVRVHRNDAGEFVISNVSGEQICVSVQRVSLPARCAIGPRGRCQVMAAGQELEFVSPPGDGACRSSTLEFRIGNELTADLPWWSETALADFDRVTGLMEAEFARASAGSGVGATDALSTRQLTDEANTAKAFLAQDSVAERWRPTLALLRQVQLDTMLAEQSGDTEARLEPSPSPDTANSQ
ncbi:MAG TPA: hypothetical protein VE046_11420 [Steroidobacteraceae bacterium]|nr:hypothetical protein [Steroidobacteraceae bacterium]